ncbi:MAG: hypothetical protein RLZZ281_1055 [Pseudomonadota bacterium]|jgi:hypothetical protein
MQLITRRPLLLQLAAFLLLGLPFQVHAHSCPLEMYKIDQALSKKPKLEAATLKKVKDLRAEGEKLHKQEKHGEAMLVLGSAKKLLKIE